jgi:hypothetical protein
MRAKHLLSIDDSEYRGKLIRCVELNGIGMLPRRGLRIPNSERRVRSERYS